MVTWREEKEKEKRKASHKALYFCSCVAVGSGDVEPSKLAVTPEFGVGGQWGYPAFRLDGACQDDKQRWGLMLSEGSFFFCERTRAHDHKTSNYNYYNYNLHLQETNYDLHF